MTPLVRRALALVLVTVVVTGCAAPTATDAPTASAGVTPTSSTSGGAATTGGSATPSIGATDATTARVTPGGSSGEDESHAGIPVVVTLKASFSAGANAVELGGSLSGVVEDGGECVYSLTSAKGKLPRMVRTRGEARGTVTSCGETTVGAEQLSSGSWSVVLAYRSRSAMAESTPVTVVVP